MASKKARIEEPVRFKIVFKGDLVRLKNERMSAGLRKVVEASVDHVRLEGYDRDFDPEDMVVEVPVYLAGKSNKTDFCSCNHELCKMLFSVLKTDELKSVQPKSKSNMLYIKKLHKEFPKMKSESKPRLARHHWPPMEQREVMAGSALDKKFSFPTVKILGENMKNINLEEVVNKVISGATRGTNRVRQEPDRLGQQAGSNLGASSGTAASTKEVSLSNLAVVCPQPVDSKALRAELENFCSVVDQGTDDMTADDKMKHVQVSSSHAVALVKVMFHQVTGCAMNSEEEEEELWEPQYHVAFNMNWRASNEPPAWHSIFVVSKSCLEGAGRGLHAAIDFEKGDKLGFYVGVVEKLKKKGVKHNPYCVEIRGRDKRQCFVVSPVLADQDVGDAKVWFGFHFANMIKWSNKVSVPVTGQSACTNISLSKNMLVTAVKNIPQGHELFLDYTGTESF